MIDTHFTRAFGLLHPYALAPIAAHSDGRLAAAVSRAGGLGLIDAGDLDAPALDAQARSTGDDAVGWGLQVARLERAPELLGQILGFKPRAILLGGGDPGVHAARIKSAGVRVISVVHSVEAARRAIAADADVIVAEGGARAGTGPATRSTFALLPEVASEIHAQHAETLLLAAGGISDPRGIAASLIMGADGVMMGTRLWASRDAALSEDQRGALLRLSGDELALHALPDARHWRGIGDTESGLPVGEGVGLIHDLPDIETLLTSLTARSARLMTCIRRKVIS